MTHHNDTGQEKEAALGNFLQQIQAVPCNAACADCNAPNPSFVSTNLGLVLCGDCAHLHETELNTYYIIPPAFSKQLDVPCGCSAPPA